MCCLDMIPDGVAASSQTLAASGSCDVLAVAAVKGVQCLSMHCQEIRSAPG